MNLSRCTDVADLSRLEFLMSILFCTFRKQLTPSPWGAEEWAIAMETQSQASSAAEKKKRVETIVATKGSSARSDISEKAVASSTTSNGRRTSAALMLSNVNSKPFLLPPRTFLLLLVVQLQFYLTFKITLIDFAHSKCNVLHSFNYLLRWENFLFSQKSSCVHLLIINLRKRSNKKHILDTRRSTAGGSGEVAMFTFHRVWHMTLKGCRTESPLSLSLSIWSAEWWKPH